MVRRKEDIFDGGFMLLSCNTTCHAIPFVLVVSTPPARDVNI